MITTTIVTLFALIIGIGIGYLMTKSSYNKRFEYLELEAKAKAKAIEQEAEKLLQNAEVDIKNRKFEAQKEIKEKLEEVEQRKRALLLKERELNEKISQVKQKETLLEERLKNVEKLEEKKRASLEEDIKKLENVSSMTKEEAKEFLLQKVEEQIQQELAVMTRKKIKIANDEAQRKANFILAQAVTRYAGEFAGERLINTISLPTDDHKGRIIGKDGRNIKTLEQLLGVDVIVDETPGIIVVSSFNLYRRAIATAVIEQLIENGRIHPGRIEEVHQKVQEEFEKKIYEEGENVIIDLGLFPMHDELIKLIGKLKYRASYGQNALAHSLEVARLARVMAAEMGGDEKLALRAGLLHDIGKALTQDFGGSHVELGAEVCRKYNEHPIVINAIYAHHGQEEPTSIEAAAVCAADALSAARPGARREVLESFTRRVKEIEDIATSYDGVSQAYAINAGREVRVFVEPDKIDDNQATLLTHKIAKEIEEKVQYPGEIKVTTIRETRTIDYAK
jgi:ribonuclease Y